MLLDSQKNGVSLRPLHCIMGQAHTAGNIVPAFQAFLWMIVWSRKIRAGLKRPGKRREREGERGVRWRFIRNTGK